MCVCVCVCVLVGWWHRWGIEQLLANSRKNINQIFGMALCALRQIWASESNFPLFCVCVRQTALGGPQIPSKAILQMGIVILGLQKRYETWSNSRVDSATAGGVDGFFSGAWRGAGLDVGPTKSTPASLQCAAFPSSGLTELSQADYARFPCLLCTMCSEAACRSQYHQTVIKSFRTWILKNDSLHEGDNGSLEWRPVAP